jgi:hypothetical protein
MGWWIFGVLGVFVIAVAFVALAVPFGPGQPLWMDLRDRLVRRVRLWP